MDQLVNLAMVLLVGTLCTALAFQLRTSNAFFLILVGMVFGYFGLLQFTKEAVMVISVLALIMVIFESTNRFTFGELRKYSAPALRLSLVYFALSVVVMSITTYFLFDIKAAAAVTFAIFAYGIDSRTLLEVLGNRKHRGYKTLKIESLINAPAAVILPLMILSAMSNVAAGKGLYEQILPFLREIVAGMCVGIIVGFLLVSVMRHSYTGDLSYLAVISAAVISYVGAELVKGNGVLSVAVFGFIFGNYHVEHKQELEGFANVFGHILTLLVFIVIGSIMIIPSKYLLKGTFLFITYIAVRYASVHFLLREFHLKERLFIALNVPKGVGLAVVILLMVNLYSKLESINVLIYLGMLFVMYSIVLSTVATTIGINLLDIQKVR